VNGRVFSNFIGKETLIQFNKHFASNDRFGEGEKLQLAFQNYTWDN
jgi:hypothetical protein